MIVELVVIAALCFSKAGGVQMTIIPSNNIILGIPTGSSQAITTFSCGNMTASETDIRSIHYISIKRITKREEKKTSASYPVKIATVQENIGAHIPGIVTDIQNTSRVPKGGIQGRISKPDYRNSYLSIGFNTVNLQCDDTGQYFCELGYLNSNNITQIETDSTSHTISALPTHDGFTLAASMNGITRNSSVCIPATMRPGEESVLTCSGLIGGNPNTQIEWLKSDGSGHLVKFIPQSQANVVETNEAIQPRPDQCTNFRTTKLKYRATINDTISNVGRLQFQCFVEVTEQGITTRVHSAIFYIQIEDVKPTLQSETSTTLSTENSGILRDDNKVAVVAGALSAVTVVLVVALVTVIIMCRKPKENVYEIPNRVNQSLEERQYSSLHAEGDYENSTLEN